MKLRIDGIALNEPRENVERRLYAEGSRNSLAWGRYSSAAGTVLVSYLPDWDEDSPESWRVRSVAGSSLGNGASTLLKVGDTQAQVEAVFGKPEERFCLESGYHCLRFGNCLVTFDSVSLTVEEFRLHSGVSAFSRPNDRPACSLLDGALAC